MWFFAVAERGCLARQFIGVALPADGTPITKSVVPTCRPMTEDDADDCLDFLTDADLLSAPVVEFYIQPANRRRIITVSTCPQRVDPVLAGVDMAITVFNISTDGTCNLTYVDCSKL